MKPVIIKVISAIIIAFVLSSASLFLDHFGAANTVSRPQNCYSGENEIGAALHLKSSYTATAEAIFASYLNTGISALDITFSKKVHGGYLSHLLFTTSTGGSYEGYIYARMADGSWIVEDKGCTPISKAFPFTHLEVGREADSTNGGASQQYFLLAGVVNDKRISYINIGFIDGSAVQVMVNPSSSTYAYARDDVSFGTKYLKGNSRDGRLVYKYDWSR